MAGGHNFELSVGGGATGMIRPSTSPRMPTSGFEGGPEEGPHHPTLVRGGPFRISEYWASDENVHGGPRTADVYAVGCAVTCPREPVRDLGTFRRISRSKRRGTHRASDRQQRPLDARCGSISNGVLQLRSQVQLTAKSVSLVRQCGANPTASISISDTSPSQWPHSPHV